MTIIRATRLDYIEKLKNLYSSGEYYIKMQQPPPREDYWEETRDPDGVLRNVFDENNIWLKNNAELVEFIIRIIQIEKPKNLLDFGCGPGYLISELRKLLPELIYVGIEESQKGYEFAQSAEIEVRRSIVDLNEKFGLVVANHVIEHLEDPIHAVRQLINLIDHNGSLVIGTPDFLSPMAVLFREKYRMLHEPSHVSLFSLDSLLRLLRDEGLQIMDVGQPFWSSPYFNKKTFKRVLNYLDEKVSPPFPGNFMLVWAKAIK